MEESPSTNKYPDLSQPFLLPSFSLARKVTPEVFKILAQLTSNIYPKKALKTAIQTLANSALAARSPISTRLSYIMSRMTESMWVGVFLANTLAIFLPLILSILYLAN
jgi:hypothetical protein